MTRRGSAPAAQRGFAMVAFVAALGVVALLIVVGNANLASREADNHLTRDRAAWLDTAAADLQSRYFRNAADQISAEDSLPESTILSRAGVTPKWGARILLSNLLTEPGSGVRYAEAVLWMPGLHDTRPDPTFNLGTGALDICPAGDCPTREFRRISGLEVQRSAVDSTLRALEALAAKATVFAKAQYLRNPEHDLSHNPFRVADCSVTEVMRPPCLPENAAGGGEFLAVTDPATGNLRELMGMGEIGLVDAWGGPLKAHNGNWRELPFGDNSWKEPPYSMAFKATTPWGADLLVVATQPL